MDPYSKVDYSHITPEAGMVMKKASGGDSPLRQGAGKSFWTLPILRRRRQWLIRLKRIYNFLYSMLVLTPFALSFVTLRGIFMHFSKLTY
jgi:hypothetical protein